MKWFVLGFIFMLGLAAVTYAAQVPSPDRCRTTWVVIEETETHEFLVPVFKCRKVES